MICKIEFNTFDASWKNLSQEGYEEIRAVVGSDRLRHEAKPDWDSSSYLVDLEQLQPLLNKHKLRVELHPTTNNMLVTLKDRVRLLESEHKLLKQELAVNGGIVQVHVPNIGLLAMTEVCHVDDACTDSLQELLNEGWRILAVCPPNAQRRPDYILGRSR